MTISEVAWFIAWAGNAFAAWWNWRNARQNARNAAANWRFACMNEKNAKANAANATWLLECRSEKNRHQWESQQWRQ